MEAADMQNFNNYVYIVDLEICIKKNGAPVTIKIYKAMKQNRMFYLKQHGVKI